jgi:hypothetical protein
MHWVKCQKCGANFKEKSDPRAEFGFCEGCRPSAHVVAAPVQDDWWSQFWREHPEIDPLRKEDNDRNEKKSRSA